MNPRKAFREFMRFELQSACEEGKLDLTDEEIEKLITYAEDDETFHNDFIDFVKDYIDWCGENFGLDDF
jgi:hypothetical protein